MDMPATAASDKWAYINTQVESPVKRIAEFRHPRTERARPEPQPIYGRNLQYPLPQNRELQYHVQQHPQANANRKDNENEQEKKRSQSALYSH